MAKKQPGWQYTKRRQASLRNARKIVTRMRKKAGVAVITKSNVGKIRKHSPKG